MSRRRLHHGNSSGEEEQEVLLGTRVGSKILNLVMQIQVFVEDQKSKKK